MSLENLCPYDEQCDQCNLRQHWLTRYQIEYAILRQGLINLKTINLISSQSMSRERATELISHQLKLKPDEEILILKVMTGHTSKKCGLNTQFTSSLSCYYPELDAV